MPQPWTVPAAAAALSGALLLVPPVRAQSDPERLQAQIAEKTARRDAALKTIAQAQARFDWGPVTFDDCDGHRLLPDPNDPDKLAWVPLTLSSPEDNWLCGARTPLFMAFHRERGRPGPRKSDFQPLFSDACRALVKAWKVVEARWAPPVPTKQTPGGWAGTYHWWKRLEDVPKRLERLEGLLKASVAKCAAGIQFECNYCQGGEGTTHFIAGNSAELSLGNPDCEICPAMCTISSRDEVVTILVHEVTHYGGTRDGDDSDDGLFEPTSMAPHLRVLADWGDHSLDEGMEKWLPKGSEKK